MAVAGAELPAKRRGFFTEEQMQDFLPSRREALSTLREPVIRAWAARWQMQLADMHGMAFWRVVHLYRERGSDFTKRQRRQSTGFLDRWGDDAAEAS